MTEAFYNAIYALNGIAGSLSAMDEDESAMTAMLVCDLAAYLTAEDKPPVWYIAPTKIKLQ
jgi:hypothetical protein